MCGIAGIYHLKQQPVANIILTKMNDAMLHRGPDGDGIWLEKNIGLAHRRLSIIDLSQHAHQPMMDTTGRYVLSYNGEVYNFRELRIELERCGHAFYSKSDTEVVLKAFAQWGEKALEKFNGMFALAIWDRQEKTLFLARDRYGIKPLYYTVVNEQVIFASEIKALLQHPDVKCQLDPIALAEYLNFQNFIQDHTLFKNINILKAGHFLRIHNENLQFSQYWDFNFQEDPTLIDEQECAEELERLVIQAVNRQLVSDVEIGAFLSGGMDSAAITSIAAKQLPYLKTFTCGFDLSSASGLEQDFDERRDAERMSYLFKTEHYEMVLKAGDMERCMKKLAYHIEEPRVGQSYPNFYAAKLASKFGKVVLAGAGGDEIFAGYPWRYYPQIASQNQDDFLKNYFQFWQRLFKDDEQTHLFKPIEKDIQGYSAFESFKRIFKASPHDQNPNAYINQCLYFEAKTFLHGLLVIDDKLSMAHSLESRVPYLDNDLVDFAMKIPASFKLGKTHEVFKAIQNKEDLSQFLQKNKDGKLIFRKAMRNHLPNDIINKTKQGFSAPDASWFKGESMEYIQNLFLKSDAKIYGFLDKKTVQDKIQEHLLGTQNHRLIIWSLLSLEKWCDQFNPDF
ncbi:MAG TPA: asparagine synthase (glutamine-hydrolyzing) [Legionellales bacterium]|nr:asparagine synthase (glutamine-hydrolyzing) [Legionellales bacterium]